MLDTRGRLGVDQATIERSWGWFVALGAGLILLGLFALSSAVVTTLAAAWVLGILLVVRGVLYVVAAFRAGGCWGIGFMLVMAVLFVAGGWILLTRPLSGALTITALLALFFVFSGLMRIFSAVVQRAPNWGWAVFGGSISLLLGALLWSQWPLSGLYAIGLFIGIDLVLDGVTWLVTALRARSGAQPASTAAV